MAVLIDSGDFPSAKGKIKGDLDRVIGKWQTKISGGFNEGAVWLLRAIEEVDDLELWKTYWGGGFDFNESREAFIQRKLLVDFDIVEDTLPAILAKLHAGEPVELTRKDGEVVHFKAAEVERAMKQVDPEAEEFVGPGAPKGNQNAVKDDGETINGNTMNCFSSQTPKTTDQNSKPGILRRLARAAQGQKSRGVVPTPERQAQCKELLRRYKNGEVSAHQAAIAAGLRKVKSPLDAALAAYRRLSPEDREKFMELIESMDDGQSKAA